MIKENTLVIANPGTGKTTTIADEISRLLEEGTDPKSILCITFTNKAVDQLRAAIDRSISQGLKQNMTAYDVDIYTFHGFAFQQLSKNDDIEDIISFNLARYLIYRKLHESHAFNYSRDYIINDIIPKLENAIRYIKSFGIKPDDIEKNKDAIIALLKSKHLRGRVKNIGIVEEEYLFKYFYDAFAYYEKKKPYPDFNDLLFNFAGLEKKDKYQYIFVDELQDVNKIEAEIALSTGEIKFLVGDRKQSIFGFQGGALSVFNSLIDDKSIAKRELTRNYRSTETIIKYARDYYLKHGIDAPELKGFSGTGNEGKKIRIMESDSPVDSIIAVLNNIDTENGTTGIIARTNSQIDDISKILDSYNIKYTSDSNIHSINQAKKDIISFFRGLFYDNASDTIAALITPFSGVPLREAFKIAESLNQENSPLEIFDEKNKFYSLRNSSIDKTSIMKLFDERILPVSASIGKEYFLTAASIKNSITDFFEFEKDYTGEKFFDYLDLAYSENSNESGSEGIILTTVHKAKGREFDNVVYLPKKARNSDAYIDIIVSSIIETVKNINVDAELGDEDIRVNFVALTRAKNTLAICVDHKSVEEYYIPEYCEIINMNVKEDKLTVPDKNRYDEAYFLFASGNYEGSMDQIKNHNSWLRDEIYKFFHDKKKLSYSLISLDNPFWLLKNNILKLNEKTDALSYGSMAHDLAEAYFNNEIDEAMLNTGEKKLKDNIESVINQIKSSYKMEQIEAEVPVIARVNQMFEEFKNVDNDIMFFGKLDAVFSDGNKYVILDYKTDKNMDRASHHRVQLLAYKILYSIKREINPADIDIAIGYISMRDKINTGKNDRGLAYKQPDKHAEEKLKSYINRFLEYRKNPDRFIDDYLNTKCDDTLYERLAQMLKK
ncbi:MAG: ATP-dependent DNA helicase [Ferroplasma sp.]